MTISATLAGAGRLDRTTRRVERTAWIGIGVVTLVQLWVHRFDMINLDGISYLEIAGAWRDGRWAQAVNAYWSPMYSWVLAVALALVRPTPAWEYPLVHAVNGAIAVAACAAFTYFIRGVAPRDRADALVMPRHVWMAFAYGLFAWATVVLLVVWMESPDLLAAVFIFLALGALARIASGSRRPQVVVLFGVALAAGYLTRAAMLPLAALFFGAALVAVGPRAWRPLTLAALAFAILAAPWVTVLSLSKGRLTAGDAGRLNYVWFVNHSEDWPTHWPKHWPQVDAGTSAGRPVHAARLLNDDPAVYEFATPIAGTYPMWYDASWWHEGIRARLSVADQVRRLKISLGDLYNLFTINLYNSSVFNPQPALAAVLAVVLLFQRAERRAALGTANPAARASRWPTVPAICRAWDRAWHGPAEASPHGAAVWVLWLPPLGALGLYALVYLEPRYVGASIVALWVLAVGSVRPSGSPTSRSLWSGAGSAMTAVLVAAVLTSTWVEAYPSARRLLRGERDQEPLAWITAQRMTAAGLASGDPIALAGNAQVSTRWAHLARVRIVAEVPPADAWKVWEPHAAERAVVTAAFRRAGARWAVLEQPNGDAPAGWRRIAFTPYVVQRLDGR